MLDMLVDTIDVRIYFNKKITILKKGKKRDKFTRCLEEITAVLTQIVIALIIITLYLVLWQRQYTSISESNIIKHNRNLSKSV